MNEIYHLDGKNSFHSNIKQTNMKKNSSSYQRKINIQIIRILEMTDQKYIHCSCVMCQQELCIMNHDRKKRMNEWTITSACLEKNQMPYNVSNSSNKKKQRKKRIFCLYGGWLVDGSGMTCIMLQIYEISKIFNHR